MPPRGDTHETQKLLLDAAESIVAAHGFNGASLRDIADRAGVNVALVKYHFGSKDGLVEAMMLRRIGPIDQRRLALLDALEAATPTGPLRLEDVLEALIRPAVEEGLSGTKEAKQFMRLIGRVFAEPPAVMGLMARHIQPVMNRFDDAFERALPGFNQQDQAWRKVACMGVIQHSLLMFSMIHEVPFPIQFLVGGPPKASTVVRRLIAFCAAGMRAQVEEGPV